LRRKALARAAGVIRRGEFLCFDGWTFVKFGAVVGRVPVREQGCPLIWQGTH